MSDAQYVFVVDDDPAVCAALGRSLRKRGYHVEDYQSAADFLAAFGTGRPGCLVLDYGMPEMNGLELQAHLVAQGRTIPIIFITGHGGIPESVAATKAGAVDFLEKPYTPSVLMERIDQALDMDRELRAAAEVQRMLTDRLAQLTNREAEIYRFMMENPGESSSKSIARAIDVSPRTVEIHRTRILQKTDCGSVAELFALYKDVRLPEPD